MAGGGNFIGRVISYVANEFIVNGLANSSFILKRDSLNLQLACPDKRHDVTIEAKKLSHAFQRFAVRTSKRIENISKLAAENKEKVAQQMEELSKNFDSMKKQ